MTEAAKAPTWAASTERAAPGRESRPYYLGAMGAARHRGLPLLFTSLPPAISRTNAAGEEIGRAYQADCIASWVDAGFAPATINARSEQVPREAGIPQVSVEQDASEITGKSHPYFGDLLSAIAGQTDGPFALVNADILIPSNAGLAERVLSLRPGEMIFTRRIDVSRLGASGKPYFWGYDFFAAHSADATALADTRLVFGGPWWDHFFPLAMHLHGCRVTQLEPKIIHLHHNERWDWTMYRKLGDRFMAEIRPMVADGHYAAHLRRILANETGGRLAAAAGLMRLRWWRRFAPEEQDRLVVEGVANLNLAVIDRLAPPPPSSGVQTPFRLRIQDKLLRLGAASDSLTLPA